MWETTEVVDIKGNQVEIRPSIGGPTEMKHVKHVKYILPADCYIKQIPGYTVFGRKTTLRLNPDKIPALALESGRFLSYHKHWLSYL